MDQKHGDIPPERADFLARDYSRGFIRHCRMRAEVIRDGFFEALVTIGEEHRQQDGFIHAGVMATMADHTAGYACFTTVPEEFQILTVEFKINFLRPAWGDTLVCRSRVIRRGTSVLVAESEVFDQREGQDVLAAKALITLAAVHRDRLRSKGF
ncbi:MAG: PaaI family thioesterase [Thermodesulfobacteriota bacterium]